MLRGLLSIICAAAPCLAEAAVQCGRRDSVVSLLGDRYGEGRRAIGMAGNDSVVEIFASDATGTWTITVTTADGTTCLLAAGEGFRGLGTAEPPPAGDPA